MEKKEHIVRASAEDITAMRSRGASRSDWKAAEVLTSAEVARLADDDDGPLPDGWETSIEIGIPATKQAVNLRLDRDVLGWFRSHGPGYQTRINEVLRAFMSARQHADRTGSKPR